jgi:hypothetical protein
MRRIRHDTCGDFECTIRRGTQPLLQGKALTKQKKISGKQIEMYIDHLAIIGRYPTCRAGYVRLADAFVAVYMVSRPLCLPRTMRTSSSLRMDSKGVCKDNK